MLSYSHNSFQMLNTASDFCTLLNVYLFIGVVDVQLQIQKLHTVSFTLHYVTITKFSA